jgi:RNA polymerase sigma factor for flagellar operon FliA
MSLEFISSAPETASSTCETWSDESSAPYSRIDEQQLIQDHLHLVRSAVARIKRTVPAHVDADDLYGIGVTALVGAVRKFCPVQGRTFAGYAALRIRGAMLDELRRLDTCSRRARLRSRQIRAATAEVEQETGRPSTPDEVRAKLNLTREEFQGWVEESQPVTFVAIDRQVDHEEGSGASFHELLADENDITGREDLEKAELAQLLALRLAELPPLQKRIISQYYFKNMRIAEIAAEQGVTSSRISQVHTRTLEDLRGWLQTAREQ